MENFISQGETVNVDVSGIEATISVWAKGPSGQEISGVLYKVWKEIRPNVTGKSLRTDIETPKDTTENKREVSNTPEWLIPLVAGVIIIVVVIIAGAIYVLYRHIEEKRKSRLSRLSSKSRTPSLTDTPSSAAKYSSMSKKSKPKSSTVRSSHSDNVSSGLPPPVSMNLPGRLASMQIPPPHSSNHPFGSDGPTGSKSLSMGSKSPSTGSKSLSTGPKAPASMGSDSDTKSRKASDVKSRPPASRPPISNSVTKAMASDALTTSSKK